MVGLFNIGTKPTVRPGVPHDHDQQHSSPVPPPPAYNDSRYASPVLVSETTTTTQVVTTTQTTTHFFSLPLWRRRPPAPTAAAASRSSVGAAPDEMGQVAPGMRIASGPVSFPPKTDKALPPTPAGSEEGPSVVQLLISRVESPVPLITQARDGQHTPLPAPSPPRNSFHSTHEPTPRSSLSDQPKFALARAALGLGLPHVMPQQLQPESSSGRSSSAASSMRRVKSFYTPEGQPSTESREAEATPSAASTTASNRRRSRGLSLGPWQLGVDMKPKAKKEDGVAPSPVLSRKGSFFGRRRKDSAKATPTPPVPPSPVLVQASPEMPTLPQVATVSPFSLNPNTMSSPLTGQLRRHNSQRERPKERPVSQQSMSMLSFMENHSPPVSPQPPVKKPSTDYLRSSPTASDMPKPVLRRPQTADGNGDRIRSYSMFLGSFPVPVVPAIEASPPLPRPSLAPSNPDTTTRRRSQTNPMSMWPSFQSFTGPPASSTAHASPTPSPRVSLNKPSAEELKPQTAESPDIYLQRLSEIVSKAEIAAVLASSSGPFHASALRTYIGQFNFINDPLDIAIRKLLMDVGLPRETQQIDRVIEAFSSRYSECNPNLFPADDQAYVLAFSLIMLHTDAFNKSNKRKMTKPDYVKNTRLPGVPPEVLEYFFDNIVFAPFIYIEDSEDVDGSHAVIAEPSRMSTFGPPTLAMGSAVTPGGSVIMARGPKIDPYYLIRQGRLDPFRVMTERHVQWETPFSFYGTGSSWDEEEIRLSFINAEVVEVNDLNEHPMAASPYFNIPVSGVSTGPIVNTSYAGALPALPVTTGQETWTLKVTKVGILHRKDDTVEGGRRAPSRRWREWTVMLTGSQLLFFRDLAWARSFLSQEEGVEAPSSLLRPDELLSVKDAVAVYDSTYHKYTNCLRFVMANGRNIFLRASDEGEMNAWIARINYASAFKTAGVRMRPSGMSKQDIELTGIAAAASHIKSTHQQSPSPQIRRWDVASPRVPAPIQELQSPEPEKPRRSFDRRSSPQLDTELVLPPQLESGPQFKAIFDQTKSDLASRPRHGRSNSMMTTNTIASSVTSPKSPVSVSEHSAYPSRATVIRGKVDDLKAKLAATQAQLDADMRFVRNIAILTPFQHATRERLDAAVQAVAKKIALVRLELARLACHRHVLEDDLASARREWRQIKAVALQAALHVIEEATTPVPEVTTVAPSEEGHIGEMVSSPVPIPRPAGSPRHGAASLERRTSSLTSFYSATDFDPEWSAAASTDDDTALAALVDGPASLEPEADAETEAEPDTEAAPTPSSAPQTDHSGFPFPPPTPPPPTRLSRLSITSHERYYTAPEGDEEAEEWNKTQAARRVSLVKLPSDLRISSIFRRSRPADSPLRSSPDSPRRSRDSART